MRRILVYSLLMALVGAVACRRIEKTNPEEEARNFGKYFVEKLSENQLDSLEDFYPQIAEAISLAPVESDTILVTEIAPDQFELTLSEGVTLTVGRSDKGNFKVYQSRGLFSFPDDKIDLAKKTGMWEEGLTDAELNERIKDDDFFEYLKKSKTVNKNSIISFTDFIESPGQDPMGNYARDGYHKITNKTDVEIDGSDYSLVYEEGYFWNDPSDGSSKKIKPGKSIPPHGTVRATASAGYHSWSVLISIKWNLSDEQLREKFAPYTGNEYQKYLDSQSKK